MTRSERHLVGLVPVAALVLTAAAAGGVIAALAQVANTSAVWAAALFAAGRAAFHIPLLIWVRPSLRDCLQHRREIATSAKTPLFATAVGSSMGVVLIVVAAALVGASITAGVWCVLPMVWATALQRTTTGFERLDWRSVAVFAIAAAGCVAIIVSQPADVRGAALGLAIGVGLALAGAALDGCSSLQASWGMRTAAGIGVGRAGIGFAMLAATAGAIVAAVVLCVVAVAVDPVIPAFDDVVMLAGFAGGLAAFGTYTSRLACIRAAHVDVFVLFAVQPVVAVAAAAALGQLRGVRLGLLGVGVCAVAAAVTLATRNRRPQAAPAVDQR